MTNLTKQRIVDGILIGSIGTAVGIPLYVWLEGKKDQDMIGTLGISVVLTAVGLAVKLLYMKYFVDHDTPHLTA